MANTLNVGLVQMRCSEDPAQNLQRAAAGIREAVRQGARIVCLPELFRTPYFCKHEDPQHFQLAEPIPGPTTEYLAALAAEQNVSILASVFEKRTDGLYHNTLVVLDPEQGYLGKYRKMHIPHDPLFEEKYYFAPGDLGFRVFDTAGVRIGTLICWDQWFPEAARLTALQGAQILFYPTAIGWLPEEETTERAAQHEAWELVQRAHAVTNGCYVVAVNRTGFEPAPPGASSQGIHFWGQSFVAAPDGTVLARAPVDEEAVLVVELDLAFIERFRTTWPFLRDRRTDAYAALTRRFLDPDG
ncbi:carbon-nitrogen hydrolase [Rhodothermus profundi]|uniref:N-carbamoylputrescine amidase n=1 Tax=Rhodothermus profundi TaxID=633813 RepID=A0A1M6P6F2_9BACT|nr:carbon-nitrogen hydrolase [Rhodothermus profundi]SHK03569.1 N-carbamoylputrescine amidase [Rhodothermus profundi]